LSSVDVEVPMRHPRVELRWQRSCLRSVPWRFCARRWRGAALACCAPRPAVSGFWLWSLLYPETWVTSR